MYFDVIEAEYKEEYKIELRFEDGSADIVDLSSYPDKNNVFSPFFDPEYFRGFLNEFGTLVWGNGELDIAPEALYMIANGKPVRYSSVVAPNWLSNNQRIR